MNKNKTILLTGGNGFIGKNIKDSFLFEKYNIIAPTHLQLDLIDTNSVDEYFKDKEFDVVLHTATKPGHRNAKDPTNLFYSNIRMFENLVRNKNKYKKFINFGSGAIYDTSKNISNVTENSIFYNMAKDEHGFCKYIVSKRINDLDNFIDLNIFGIFGKYEDWQIRFISNAICKTLFGLPITLRQNRKFSYLYIDDLMPILEFFIENDLKYKQYNIVPNEQVELFEIAKIVKNIYNKNIEIKIAKEGYGLEYTGCNERLVNEFKNVKFTYIEKAIKFLYNYYSKNINLIDKNLLLIDK
jgi:GDP-L-fucose synthase